MTEIGKTIIELEKLEQQIKDLQEAKAGFYEHLKNTGHNISAIKMAVKYKMMSDEDRTKFAHDLNCTYDYLNEVNIQLKLFNEPVLKAITA